ncbi:PTS sugar transporter subunit IIB [Candidatus Enterococcus ferrettii]|uniref:PTS system, mannose-specific IIB component n=1 Tax=Candidatus Enterococcus ferrettii TaxID=2815324 RepID=A0ABV0ESF2_9ENTE|nr:PTS sugar transporter subunit IIB [Enterococcus sp. 665A]MBO1340595.1 PTS sugar transporter subunit IIB [Enterococcus sp. 665A]
MKGIKHIRIDDRLIHGQVAGLWTNNLKANRIMVINDPIAADEVQKNLLRMVAPPTVRTSIIARDTAVANILNGKYHGQNVFIVVKSPEDVLYLLNNGLDIKEVNLGNISSRENTEKIKAGINVTASERAALKELLAKGVRITTIRTPSDPVVELTVSEL